MGNCLVTKLNGAVNEILPKMGELLIDVKSASSEHMITISSNSTNYVINAYGDGAYFMTSSGGEHLTSLSVNVTTGIDVYLPANVAFKLGISEKYSLRGVFFGQFGYNLNLTTNLADVKYSSSLVNLSTNTMGSLESVKDLQNLDTLVIGNTINGNLNTLGKLINLITITFIGNSIYGDFLEFFQAQSSNGRNSGRITARGILNNNITFNGVTLKGGGNPDITLVFDSVTTFHINAGSELYCYGASTEQIAEWESQGVNVVPVD